MLKKKRKPYSLRLFEVGTGLPPVPNLMAELLDMTDVLLGRVEPPINSGISTLMEVADAYYARALEMRMLIMQAERDGQVRRGSALYRFRTGELSAFLDMAKSATTLGSRRVTVRQMTIESERTGRHNHHH